MKGNSRVDNVARVSALDDPSRRMLYDLVSRSDHPLGRDEASDRAGLPRSTTAFHLDRLARDGLLQIEYKRLSGKSGPGAGRPAKLYSRADEDVQVSLPERNYELVGDLLAGAIEASSESGRELGDVLREVAGEAGRELGSGCSCLEQALETGGFEPSYESSGDIVLGNCPFQSLARRHTDLVCELNLELVRGMAVGAEDHDHLVVRDVTAGRCCVRATSADAATG